MEEKKSQSGGMFDQLPPKFAFWAGVVTSSAVWAIVALVILLVLVFGGDGLSTDSKKTTNTNKAVAAADAGTGEEAAAQDSVDMDSLRNVKGEGELTIIEYSDFDCPFCQRFHPTVQSVVDQYEGQVAWAFKHFPLTSLHPNAEDAAVGAECAAAQDKFWEFTDTYFDASSGITSTGDNKINDVADQIGLNADEFATCLEDTDVRALVRADASEAQALGGRGTPFSVIVDEDGTVVGTIPGALQEAAVVQTIEGLLN